MSLAMRHQQTTDRIRTRQLQTVYGLKAHVQPQKSPQGQMNPCLRQLQNRSIQERVSSSDPSLWRSNFK